MYLITLHIYMLTSLIRCLFIFGPITHFFQESDEIPPPPEAKYQLKRENSATF
jgi:hypothetical protein